VTFEELNEWITKIGAGKTLPSAVRQRVSRELPPFIRLPITVRFFAGVIPRPTLNGPLPLLILESRHGESKRKKKARRVGAEPQLNRRCRDSRHRKPNMRARKIHQIRSRTSKQSLIERVRRYPRQLHGSLFAGTTMRKCFQVGVDHRR